MTSYGPMALAHAAGRGYRRSGDDLRTAMAVSMVMQIEAEHRAWRDSHGRHPADDYADACIERMRNIAGRGLAGARL